MLIAEAAVIFGPCLHLWVDVNKADRWMSLITKGRDYSLVAEWV